MTPFDSAPARAPLPSDSQNAPWVRAGTPALLLAPMEGVTDAPMRALMAERGGFSFCVGEFLRVSQEVPPSRVFRLHLPELAHGCRTPSGLPVQVQILGGDPERVALTARRAIGLGAEAIDLNFGCPAPTVNRHDGGATLLKHPLRLRAIVEAVRAAVPRAYPVSAKLRLGWDCRDAIHETSERAAEGGADWITIHGRTRLQGYAPPAYWGPIGEVRRRLAIPVVANGDIWTLEDLRRCREETDCEHFMIGRSALADPNLPWAAARELGLPGDVTEPVTPLPATREAWRPLIERFVSLSLSSAHHSAMQTACRVKQWVRMASLRRPIPWFDELKRLSDLDAVLAYFRGCDPV